MATIERAAVIVELARRCQKPLPLVIEREIESIDVPAWTLNHSEKTVIYWASRDRDFEIGGLGYGYRIDGEDGFPSLGKAGSIIDLGEDRETPFFHARTFFDPYPADIHDPVWRNFPTDISFIPSITLTRRGSRYHLSKCVEVSPEDSPEQLVSAIQKVPDKIDSKQIFRDSYRLPEIDSIEHFPGHDGWSKNVLEILSSIAKADVEKTVLARRSDIHFVRDIDPFGLFLELKKYSDGCYVFIFQPEPGRAFISFSPERLYRRDGSNLLIDALSSTVIRGEGESEDRLLEKYLRESSKERREHRQVIEGIRECADDVCTGEIDIGETGVMKLGLVQHLRTPIKAQVAEGVTDSEIVRCLHPTPAVGGRPRKRALRLIRKLEPFERGWYASPAGYASCERAEFSVAIRSLVVDGRRVSVFSGAGIVAGSEPEAEWYEIENKNVLRPLVNRVVGK